MGYEFDEQTAVRAVAPDVFETDLHPGWAVGGGLNGGYLLAVIGTAVRAIVPGKPDPLAVSAHIRRRERVGHALLDRRQVRFDGGRAHLVGQPGQVAVRRQDRQLARVPR